MMKRKDGWPRRSDMAMWTPLERAIWDVKQQVERMGAHVLLTDAVNLLGYAQEKIAEYVEIDPPQEWAERCT